MEQYKGKKKVVFKTIDYPTLIEELVADRNSHHLNQTQGSPFTVEPLQSLLGTDSDTPFAEALLNGDTNLLQVPLTNVTKRYLESIPRNKEIIHSLQQQKFHSTNTKMVFVTGRERPLQPPQDVIYDTTILY